MRAFFNWTLKNLSNIFSVLGIALTFYFGIFYVPDWLKESQNQRVINAQQNLIQSIKELVYSDSVCSYTEISLLIKAKEIELKDKLPLTTEQILVIVQESFMQDKFLPLSKRKELIGEVEALKKDIPASKSTSRLGKKKSSFDWITILSILGSLLAAGIGIFSLYTKSKEEKEKQEEIDNQMKEAEQTEQGVYTFEQGSDYTNAILNEITSFPGVKILPMESAETFDLKFKYESNLYFVEVKYFTKSKAGVKSFYGFTARQKGLEGNFWFIYNTDITEMVKKEAEHLNRMVFPWRKLKLIRAENPISLRRQLDALLNAK